MGADQRIGTLFMRPGIGYGGSCFPKDLAAFRAVAREFGYDFRLLEEVMRINEEQRHIFLRKVRSALWTLKGKRLAVLGLAFKGGTDDIRDSPAIAVIRMLAEGALRDRGLRSGGHGTRPQGICRRAASPSPRAPTRRRKRPTLC